MFNSLGNLTVFNETHFHMHAAPTTSQKRCGFDPVGQYFLQSFPTYERIIRTMHVVKGRSAVDDIPSASCATTITGVPCLKKEYIHGKLTQYAEIIANEISSPYQSPKGQKIVLDINTVQKG